MVPRIRYAKTSDGVNIAYWTMGRSGTPLILAAPLGHSHISAEFQVPGLGEWYRRLAAKRMIVRYDHRAFGMSQRDIREHSVAGWGRDLEAVVRELNSDSVHLYGCSSMCQGPVVVAAEMPDRVDRVVLAYPNNVDFPRRRPHTHDALLSLAKSDWETFSETVAHALAGWAPGSQAHGFAAFIRESISQQDQIGLIENAVKLDVTDYMPRVRAPTLVLGSARGLISSRRAFQPFATRIPCAHLTLIEDDAQFPGDLLPHQNERISKAVERFLDKSADETDEPGPATQATSLQLTSRELEVLRLLVAGKTNQQIADELMISVNTVLRHVSHIYGKMGVANRAEAAACGSRNGLLN